jgi:glycosyltransferase involved in cell wall biosynthesis
VAGAEVLVTEIIRRLGSRLDPIVICLDGIGQLGERLLAQGVPVLALGRRPGVDLPLSRRLARELGRRRIDVVHAHQYTPFFYSALAKLQLRRRPHLIFTEHGRHYPDVVSARRRMANRVLLSRMADEITGVCQFSATSLAGVDGFGGRRIHVIENGIDIPAMKPHRAATRARLGLDPHRQYVICVARFHPVKDHDTLLRAFSIAARAHPDTDLLLVGTGPLDQALERQAAALDIQSRVRFLGVRNDVPALLSAADVFAMTSVSEAASLTLLEAMAAALPVVVTDVGGNPEIVRDGVDGALVPRGDAVAAARALQALLADPAARASMGAAARRRVCEHYRLETTVQNYYERYVAACEGAQRAS